MSNFEFILNDSQKTYTKFKLVEFLFSFINIYSLNLHSLLYKSYRTRDEHTFGDFNVGQN